MPPSALAPDQDRLLALHALGALDPIEAARAEELAREPAARRALDGYRRVLGELAALARAHAPAPSVRLRLLASVDLLVRPGRLDRFATRLAAMFDVTLDKARMFLGWIDDPARWEPTVLPHVRQAHLPPGPAWAAADCGLVRMPAGSRFPWHIHEGGEEVTLVLQGRARYAGGLVVGPGDEVVAVPGSVHDFLALDGDEYLFAVRFFGIRPVPPPGV